MGSIGEWTKVCTNSASLQSSQGTYSTLFYYLGIKKTKTLGQMLSVRGNLVLLFDPKGSDTIGCILEFRKGSEMTCQNLEFPKQNEFYKNFSNLVAASEVVF